MDKWTVVVMVYTRLSFSQHEYIVLKRYDVDN